MSKKTTTKSERNFALESKEVVALKADAKKTKSFPNPFQKGAYHFSIDALATLGVNKWHSLASFIKAFEKSAGAEWSKAFKSKKARNKESGKDYEGRVIQNLIVCGQRPKDYSKKLSQVGACIDLKRDGETVLVRLNTTGAECLKLGRAAKAEKVIAKKTSKVETKKVVSNKPPILSGREAIAALKKK